MTLAPGNKSFRYWEGKSITDQQSKLTTRLTKMSKNIWQF